jgi:hypothetical protein
MDRKTCCFLCWRFQILVDISSEYVDMLRFYANVVLIIWKLIFSTVALLNDAFSNLSTNLNAAWCLWRASVKNVNGSELRHYCPNDTPTNPNTPMACLALAVGASVMKRSRSNVRAKGFARDFLRCTLLSMWQALIFTYIFEPVYKMVWRCDGTYSWIYWRIKEMDIADLFLPT